MKKTSSLPTISLQQLKIVSGGGLAFGTSGVGISLGGPLMIGANGQLGIKILGK